MHLFRYIKERTIKIEILIWLRWNSNCFRVNIFGKLYTFYQKVLKYSKDRHLNLINFQKLGYQSLRITTQLHLIVFLFRNGVVDLELIVYDATLELLEKRESQEGKRKLKFRQWEESRAMRRCLYLSSWQQIDIVSFVVVNL